MISTKTHGVIDYVTGILLLAAPYLFGFATGGIEHYLPMALGAMTILMSLFTDYELSIARAIPLPVHLGVDVLSGVLLLVSPWVFNFAHIIWWPHVLVGILEIVVPLMTERPDKSFSNPLKSR